MKRDGFILLIGFCLGAFLVYKIMPRPLAPIEQIIPIAKKNTHKVYSKGELLSEDIIETIPMPNPKPKYKITLFPIYDFQKQSAYFAGLYEKRYDLPFIREVYLGVYINSRLEVGVSLSKEFY